MTEHTTTYVAFDNSKDTLAVGIAEDGLRGEVRFWGTIPNRPEAVRKLVAKLVTRHPALSFCYEAGPCGYGLYRQILALGHPCLVVAPSLIPTKPGGHIKTDRRDATMLASLFRAGELQSVWVPDAEHEAMRALIRGRQTRDAGGSTLTSTGAVVPTTPRPRNAHPSALDQGTPGLAGPAKLLPSRRADRVRRTDPADGSGLCPAMSP